MVESTDINEILSETLIVRLSSTTMKELKKEMKEKGIRKISTYIRLIIAKRNQKNSRKSNEKDEKFPAITSKDLAEMRNNYNEALHKIRDISKLKNSNGEPVINEKNFIELVKKLHEETNKLYLLLKKITDDNKAS